MTDLEKQINEARLQAVTERRNARMAGEYLPNLRRHASRARRPEFIHKATEVLLEMRRMAQENAKLWDKAAASLSACTN